MQQTSSLNASLNLPSPHFTPPHLTCHPRQVLMRTLADCQLAVSVYPTFAYDAAGGGGTGSVTQGEDGLLHLSFDPTALAIPPINAQHASIIGIPVPPPFNIAIVPQRLEGTLDPVTGRCDLEFLASFEFTAGVWGIIGGWVDGCLLPCLSSWSLAAMPEPTTPPLTYTIAMPAGPLYRAAPLTVATTLTTEASDGVMRHGVGQRLRADGRARLVGVARVPRTEDAFVNTFLQLPTDALAVLSAELEFS